MACMFHLVSSSSHTPQAMDAEPREFYGRHSKNQLNWTFLLEIPRVWDRCLRKGDSSRSVCGSHRFLLLIKKKFNPYRVDTPVRPVATTPTNNTLCKQQPRRHQRFPREIPKRLYVLPLQKAGDHQSQSQGPHGTPQPRSRGGWVCTRGFFRHIQSESGPRETIKQGGINGNLLQVGLGHGGL